MIALLAALSTAAISAPHSTGSSSSAVSGARVPCAPQAVTAPLTTPSAGGSSVNGPREVDVGARLLMLDSSPRAAAPRDGERADRGVGGVQQVVVHPAPPLGDRAEDALGEAAERAPRRRPAIADAPAQQSPVATPDRADRERAREAGERALEAHGALGAWRNGPKRRDQERAPAEGLADLGRAGVGGRGGDRSRVSDRQHVARPRRRHAREHGERCRDSAVGPGVLPPARPALLLCDAARRLLAVAELRGGRAQDEEGDHQREALRRRGPP